MRFVVAALVALFVFVPAAQAQVTFTGVPESPTKLVTFDVGFNSPGAVRYDCVHVFPDGAPSETPGCESPFPFVDLVDGRHELRVTATDADGVKTERSTVIVVDAIAPPAPVITAPVEAASLQQLTMTGTTATGTTVTILDGTAELGQATVTGEAWTFAAADLPEGPHTLTAVASDATGSTQSAPRTITIDRTAPAAPAITAPTDPTVTRERVITLRGSAEDGSTVEVSDGTTIIGTKPGGAWELATPALADGEHTFTAVAIDAAGNRSGPSNAVHVTVDTVAPEVTITGAPTGPTSDFTFDLGFSASEPVVFDCVHVFPDDDDDEFLDCEPPFELRELADGVHELRVTATDTAGNTGTRSVSFTIDTQAPAAVEPAQTGPSEFAFAGEAGAAFECSVDGAGFTPCSSPQQLSGLAAGAHTFAVLAVDAAGNRSTSTTRTFTVAPPPAATPVATVAATPSAVVPSPAAPAAELGRTLVARTVSGKVYVRRPATAAPLDLGTVAGIPVGTEIDARKGRVRLTAAARPGKAAHRAEFSGGVFIVTQAADDIVDLRLSEAFGSCAKKTGTRVRRLWGDGKGRFRTRGLNSIATVRGTRWLVQDSCEGTLTRVTQGVVSVRDTVKRKTFLVRAGRKYLAVPKKRK